jgi:hypothetical protein
VPRPEWLQGRPQGPALPSWAARWAAPQHPSPCSPASVQQANNSGHMHESSSIECDTAWCSLRPCHLGHHSQYMRGHHLQYMSASKKTLNTARTTQVSSMPFQRAQAPSRLSYWKVLHACRVTKWSGCAITCSRASCRPSPDCPHCSSTRPISASSTASRAAPSSALPSSSGSLGSPCLTSFRLLLPLLCRRRLPRPRPSWKGSISLSVLQHCHVSISKAGLGMKRHNKIWSRQHRQLCCL